MTADSLVLRIELENDRIVGRAQLLAILHDPESHPLRDLAAAKTRELRAV